MYADNFTTNPFFENLTENNLRGKEFRVIAPLNNTLSVVPAFLWSDTTIQKLKLVLFSNKGKIIFSELVTNGTKPDIFLDPGIYYWQL
jgi:hypothetical protein